MEPAKINKTKRRRSSNSVAAGPKGSPKVAKVVPSPTPTANGNGPKPKRNLRQEKMAKKRARLSEESSPKGKNVKKPQGANVNGKNKGKDKPTSKPPPKVEYHSTSEAEESDEDEGSEAVDAEAEAEAARVEKKKFGARRRKKGKVFMEDKASLLNLLDNVTTSKNAVITAKLDKERDRAAAAKALVAKREAGKKGRKADERAKAMDAAKEAILVRDREKKEKRKRKKGGAVATPTAAPKKRVGFA